MDVHGFPRLNSRNTAHKITHRKAAAECYVVMYINN
jgi:hypothetical protein